MDVTAYYLMHNFPAPKRTSNFVAEPLELRDTSRWSSTSEIINWNGGPYA